MDVFPRRGRLLTAAPNGNCLATAGLAPLAVYPVAYLTLGSSGTAITPTAGAPNPTLGIFGWRWTCWTKPFPMPAPARRRGRSSRSAVVTVPSRFAIPMGYCSQSTLCVDRVDNTGARIIEGNLQDKLLLQTSKGWVGNSKDGAAGRRTPSASPRTRWPQPVATRNICPPASISPRPAACFRNWTAALPAGSNRSLSWKSWARANPACRFSWYGQWRRAAVWAAR